MRFGVVLPTYPAGATFEGVVKVAQAVKRPGSVSVWTTDYVVSAETVEKPRMSSPTPRSS